MNESAKARVKTHAAEVVSRRINPNGAFVERTMDAAETVVVAASLLIDILERLEAMDAKLEALDDKGTETVAELRVLRSTRG